MISRSALSLGLLDKLIIAVLLKNYDVLVLWYWPRCGLYRKGICMCSNTFSRRKKCIKQHDEQNNFHHTFYLFPIFIQNQFIFFRMSFIIFYTSKYTDSARKLSSTISSPGHLFQFHLNGHIG